MEVLRVGRGQGRPCGRVARGSLGSKGKVSEWRNFKVEWLLVAANGEEPQGRIHTWRLCLKLALNPDPYKKIKGSGTRPAFKGWVVLGIDAILFPLEECCRFRSFHSRAVRGP